jgi:hypothetical protein
MELALDFPSLRAVVLEPVRRSLVPVRFLVVHLLRRQSLRYLALPFPLPVQVGALGAENSLRGEAHHRPFLLCYSLACCCNEQLLGSRPTYRALGQARTWDHTRTTSELLRK